MKTEEALSVRASTTMMGNRA